LNIFLKRLLLQTEHFAAVVPSDSLKALSGFGRFT